MSSIRSDLPVSAKTEFVSSVQKRPINVTDSTSSNTGDVAGDRPIGTWILLTLLGGVSLFYAVILVYHAGVPPKSGSTYGVLENCREFCLRYGLVSASEPDSSAEPKTAVISHSGAGGNSAKEFQFTTERE
jgi:hypothetical protein